MKKYLLVTLLLGGLSAFSQDYCRIQTDSIESGNNATAHSIYYYNSDVKLIAVERIDSNSNSINYLDTAYYAVDGRLEKVETYEFWTNSMLSRSQLSYNGDNKVSRVDESGTNGNGAWTKSSDLIYNGSGQLTDILVDSSSITGQPEGIIGDWTNIIWSGGNIVSATLSTDLGFGADDYELAINYDAMNNLGRLKMLRGADDFVFRWNANNPLAVKFANNELFGFTPVPAGTAIFNYAYSYDSYNEVTLEDVTSPLAGNMTTSYVHTCNTSNSIMENSNGQFELVPNPATDILTIKTEVDIKTVNVYDIRGVRILQANSNLKQLKIADLPRGVYIVEVLTETQALRNRLIKE